MAITDIKVVRALKYASGTGSINGATVDMLNYEGITLIVDVDSVGASASGCTVKLECSDAANMASAKAITGATKSIDDYGDDSICIIDVKQVPKRYVRVVLTKDNVRTIAASAVYLLYNPDYKPQDSDQGNAGSDEYIDTTILYQPTHAP